MEYPEYLMKRWYLLRRMDCNHKLCSHVAYRRPGLKGREIFDAILAPSIKKPVTAIIRSVKRIIISSLFVFILSGLIINLLYKAMRMPAINIMPAISIMSEKMR